MMYIGVVKIIFITIFIPASTPSPIHTPHRNPNLPRHIHNLHPPSSISASFIAIDDVSITYIELRDIRRHRRRPPPTDHLAHEL
jgi:hypothetical protein